MGTYKLDWTAWMQTVKVIQHILSDQVIKAAVSRMPAELRQSDGLAIKEKLIARRNDLQSTIVNYYHFLARKVKIDGTKEDELFDITSQNEKVCVTIYRFTEGKVGDKVYRRWFDPHDTHLVILNGSKGKDAIQIDETVHSLIKSKIWQQRKRWDQDGIPPGY